MEGLACFPTSVPRELSDDLKPLNAFDPSDLDALATVVLDHLSTPQTLIAAVTDFAQVRDVKKSLLEKGVRGLVALLQAAGHHDKSAADVKSDAALLGLDDAHASALGRAFDSFALRDLFSDTTMRQLVDLEWKFGVTCASSESDKPVGKTFLQLKLLLDNKNGQVESVYLELTLPQFYDFLAHMEKAKRAMDSVQP